MEVMSWTETAVGMAGERTPLDLVVIGTWAVASAVWAVIAGNAVPAVTAVLALPLVVAFPGYVFVAVLFPESASAATGESDGIRPLERGVLSAFVSVVAIPFAALAVEFSPWLIGPATVLFTLSLVTLVGAAVASVRRVRVPANRRFGVSVGEGATVAEQGWHNAAERGWRNAARSVVRAVTGGSAEAVGDARRTRLLNALVVLAVVAAVGSVAQIAVVSDGPDYTETYLLTENESGSLVAADYPANMTLDRTSSLVVGIENHRGEPVNYTVVVQLQRVTSSGNSSEVVAAQSIARFDRRLAPGERALVDHIVTPRMTGERLRLAYLVYAGSPPDRPSLATADSEVHLWVSVDNRSAGANDRRCPSGCR